MSSHAFHQLYYHFAWAIKNRLPLITDATRDWLIECIENEVRKRDGTLLACNAMPDHAHLFVSLPPTVGVATFIGQIKGASSRLYTSQFGEAGQLVWQTGYGVITCRKAEADKVIRYVLNQQEIHASRKISRLLETMEAECDSFPRIG